MRQIAYAALPRDLPNARPGWPGWANRSPLRYAMDGSSHHTEATAHAALPPDPPNARPRIDGPDDPKPSARRHGGSSQHARPARHLESDQQALRHRTNLRTITALEPAPQSAPEMAGKPANPAPISPATMQPLDPRGNYPLESPASFVIHIHL